MRFPNIQCTNVHKIIMVGVWLQIAKNSIWLPAILCPCSVICFLTSAPVFPNLTFYLSHLYLHDKVGPWRTKGNPICSLFLILYYQNIGSEFSSSLGFPVCLLNVTNGDVHGRCCFNLSKTKLFSICTIVFLTIFEEKYYYSWLWRDDGIDPTAEDFSFSSVNEKQEVFRLHSSRNRKNTQTASVVFRTKETVPTFLSQGTCVQIK